MRGIDSIRGLPFSRIYSLEDVGYVPRGSRLNFDAFGRVAVIHEGVYAVGGHYPRGSEAPRQSDHDPDHKQPRAFSRDHPKDVARAGAKRHPQTDFLRLLRHRV